MDLARLDYRIGRDSTDNMCSIAVFGVSLVSTVPESLMMSGPGADRISSVTTFYEISLDNQAVGLSSNIL